MRVEEARQVLTKAAEQAGGVPQLAEKLDLSERILRHYIDGHEPIPETLYLMVVDVIMKGIPPGGTN